MTYKTEWIEKSTKTEPHINMLKSSKIQMQIQNDRFLISFLKKQYYLKKKKE